MVDRISYIGTCQLLLPTEEVSLKSAANCAATTGTSHGANPTIIDPRIVGVLLERQLDSLGPSRWKENVHGVFVRLLRDALDVYRVEDVVDSSNGMPVRRARVLVRCMEFVYRDHGQDGWSAFGFANVDEIGREIERLVMMSVRSFLIIFCRHLNLFINIGPWEGYTIGLLWCSISNGFTSMDGSPCTSACGSRTKCFDDPTYRRSLQVD